jgi:hypothetical protein
VYQPRFSSEDASDSNAPHVAILWKRLALKKITVFSRAKDHLRRQHIRRM